MRPEGDRTAVSEVTAPFANVVSIFRPKLFSSSSTVCTAPLARRVRRKPPSAPYSCVSSSVPLTVTVASWLFEAYV